MSSNSLRVGVRALSISSVSVLVMDWVLAQSGRGSKEQRWGSKEQPGRLP